MKIKSSNPFRTNIVLTEKNGLIAKELFGGYSAAANMGIEMLAEFNISVYIIKHRFIKRCFIGVYNQQVVPDVYYHYVHNLGSETLGHQIREEGVSFFEFYVLGKFSDIKEAKAVCRMFFRVYQKAGYTPLNKGLCLLD